MGGRILLVVLGAFTWLGAAGCADDSSAPGAAGAMVVGTLTLPGTAMGKPFSVKLFRMAGVPGMAPVAETSGSTTGSTMLSYTIAAVPAGSYFVLGFVDVDASGGDSSTVGDYRGWYGHTGDGNPPASPNAVVPASGTARFDFGLVLRQ
jgi:hypothetical protein